MKNTTDIWFASFLFGKGHKIVKIDNSSGRRASFYFDIDGDDWDKLKLEFGQSPDIQIKYTHEKLKDLIYQ